MENVADQIFKTFHHIAREVQIYFLSGFLVLMNCLLLDSLYFDYSHWVHQLARVGHPVRDPRLRNGALLHGRLLHRIRGNES